jgi:hypothetical protein
MQHAGGCAVGEHGETDVFDELPKRFVGSGFMVHGRPPAVSKNGRLAHAKQVFAL